MKYIKVNYKITIYDLEYNVKVIDNLCGNFNSNILFPQLINLLIKENNIKYFQIYVENLKYDTWGKLFGEDLYNQIEGDNYHYKWLNYNLKDIQNAFNYFNNKINIIVDGPGVGDAVGRSQGITFYINNDEKDRHQFEPHVHCKYSGEEMRIRIDKLTIMGHDKPFKNKRKVKLTLRWVKRNQNSLLNYYNNFAINKNNNIKFIAKI